MPTKAATRGVPVALQTAATALGNGQVIALPNSFKNHTLYIKGSVGVATGAIQPEVSTYPENADALWAPVGGGPITVLANQTIVVNVVGVFGAIRARVSTVMAGGTVSVDYVGS